MREIAEYLEGLDEAQRAALGHVVDVARTVAPDADEGRSYGVAALMIDGRPLLGINTAAKHLAIFPFSPAVVTAVADQLDGFALSKGTVRFTVDRPVPDQVIEEMVRLRLAELRG